MRKLISKLILFGKDFHLLNEIAYALKAKEENNREEFEIIIRQSLREIIDIAVKYGFYGNIWQDYITYLMLTDENPFTLNCERCSKVNESLAALAKNDLEILRKLFDVKIIEDENVLSIIENFKYKNPNTNIGEKVSKLSVKISKAKNVEEIFRLLLSHYKITVLEYLA